MRFLSPQGWRGWRELQSRLCSNFLQEVQLKGLVKGHEVSVICDPPEWHVVLWRERTARFMQGFPAELEAGWVELQGCSGWRFWAHHSQDRPQPCAHLDLEPISCAQLCVTGTSTDCQLLTMETLAVSCCCSQECLSRAASSGRMCEARS